MENNFIRFEEGKQVKCEELNKYYPFVLIRYNPIHLQVCEFVANNYFDYNEKSLEWKVLVNFLHQRSNKLKIISSIIILSKFEKISEINIDYLNSDFSIFFENNIKFKSRNEKAPYFIDNKQVISSFVKYFPNVLYRNLKKRNLEKKKVIIRAWIDLDEHLHKADWQSSNVYIYPFSFNFFNGIKFILRSYKTNSGVTVNGIQYSFSKLIKIFFSQGVKRDMAIIDYEINGLKSHAKDFKMYDQVLTSDEFIPAAPALYGQLDKSIKVLNNAHGIGLYNPYIKYDEMLVFNVNQKEFYKSRNTKTKFILKENINDIKVKSTNSKTFKNMVYIDQGDLKKFKYYYEAKIQNSVVNKINDIYRHKTDKPKVKFHPNRSQNEKRKFLIKFPQFDELKNFNPEESYIFINLYSTAYYDFKKYGDFFFIEEGIFNPSILFGDSINKISINDLTKLINN